jgi:hypothetical protein
MLVVLMMIVGGESELPLRMDFESPRLEVPLVELESGHWHLGIAASAQARVAIPFGTADPGVVRISGNVITIDHRVDYLDLFNPGFGATLEADFLSRPPDRPAYAREPALGGYVAVEWDRFEGSSAEADPGVKIRPDTLELASFLVGFKAEGAIEGPLYGDFRAGLGGVHYPSLHADFAPTGFPAARGELFAESWAFALEVRLHFGWREGPLGLFFGFGTRLLAPPARGANSPLDPGVLFLLDFEVGVELGF